jgi:hypothetical protein
MVKESYRTVRKMGLKAWPPIMSSRVPLGCRVDATLAIVGIHTPYERILRLDSGILWGLSAVTLLQLPICA